MSNKFFIEWTARLLDGIRKTCTPETAKACLAECTAAHFQANHMDEQLEPYIGKSDEFIHFLTREYGWLIEYDRETQTLFIDENKDFCVCPIVSALGNGVSPVICGCSAHYAKKMFDKVTGRQVQVKILRSILNDKQSCIYQVSLADSPRCNTEHT